MLHGFKTKTSVMLHGFKTKTSVMLHAFKIKTKVSCYKDLKEKTNMSSYMGLKEKQDSCGDLKKRKLSCYMGFDKSIADWVCDCVGCGT